MPGEKHDDEGTKTDVEPAGASLDLEERMARYSAPALSLAFINDGVITPKTLGVIRLGADGPATPRTLFQAASISKPITALVALELAERGVLDLDTDVNEHLRSWRVPGQRRVTLRQLLSHTASTTVSGFPGYRVGDVVPTVVEILDGQAPANTPAVLVDGPPGPFRYSGGGYEIVHLLIEDVTGAPFADVAIDIVLEPCGMADSGFVQPPTGDLASQAAIGHWSLDAIEGGWFVYPELAAAGLWATPTDLARLVVAIQRALRDEAGPVRPSVARHLVGPVAAIPADPATAAITGSLAPDAVGLGMFRIGTAFGHSGGNVGFVSVLAGGMETGRGVVAMTNCLMAGLLAEVAGAVMAA